MSYLDEIKKEANLVENKAEHDDNSKEVDNRILELSSKKGFHTIDMSKLPSKGRFYPSNMTISIRSLQMDEILYVAEVNEKNVIDVYGGFNDVLSDCCRVRYSNTAGSYKDILKCDETVLAYYIRELTWPSATINLTIPEGTCKNGCRGDNKVDVRLSDCTIEAEELPADIMKYYNENERVFEFKFKNGESIKMKPTTIGSHAAAWNYAVQNELQKKSYDKVAATHVPLMLRWEEINDKAFFDYSSQMYGWPLEKFAAINNLAKQVDNYAMDLTIKDVTCPSCGGLVDIQTSFQDSIYTIFVPSVSSESDYGLV